ncbi:MAG: glycosyltransferase [Hyphomicrobium sp.]
MVRARMQERHAEQAKRRIEQEAAARGIVAPSTEETAAALRARLAGRAKQNGWPRRKGDLHIFLAFQLFEWLEALPAAFEPFGEVTVFDLASHGFDQGRADWWERRPIVNREMLAAFHEANARRPVDAVVGYLSGVNTDPATLARIARAGTAIFNFSYDEKLDMGNPLPDGSIRSPAALASVVDLNLTNDPAGALRYLLKGGLAHFHPEAADPRVHRPYDTPFRYDVTFVGQHYGFRPFFIERLQSLGINVTAFGRNWPNGPLALEEMVEMYSLSRINLGFGGIGHSNRLMCLKGRDFEVPMSGGLFLTQHNPELELVFDVGREIMTYTGEADCAVKIRTLLADEAKAAAIRKAGRERCLRDHTYEARWTKVFQMAGVL